MVSLTSAMSAFVASLTSARSAFVCESQLGDFCVHLGDVCLRGEVEPSIGRQDSARSILRELLIDARFAQGIGTVRPPSCFICPSSIAPGFAPRDFDTRDACRSKRARKTKEWGVEVEGTAYRRRATIPSRFSYDPNALER